MTQKITQFQRLKSFINKIGVGNTFTTTQLQYAVGNFEKTSHWKRSNNVPYYTTYLYRGQLRDMGCVSMVKRGLWKVEHNIPKWFGSFHFKGLHGGYDPKNKYADHTCTYWNNLPAEHKVNPFKNKPIADNNPTEIVVKTNIKLDVQDNKPSFDLDVEAVVGVTDTESRYVKSVKYFYGDHKVELDEKGMNILLKLLASPGQDTVMLQDIHKIIIGESFLISYKPLEKVVPTSHAQIHELLSKVDWNLCIENAINESISINDFDNATTFAVYGREIFIESVDTHELVSAGLATAVMQSVSNEIKNMLGA
jgi:hypothetical protein